MPSLRQCFSLLTVLVLMLLLAACGSQATVVITVNTPATSPASLASTPTGPTIGGPVKQQGYVLTVTAAETGNQNIYGETADQGFIFVELNITLGSELNKGFIFQRQSLSLIDETDTTYILTDTNKKQQLGLTNTSKKQQLDMSYYDLAKGQSVSGWVEFEVHTSASKLKLVYNSPDYLIVPLKVTLPASTMNTPTTALSSLQFSAFSAPDNLFTILMPASVPPQASEQPVTLAGQKLVVHQFKAFASEQKVLCITGYVSAESGSSLTLGEIRKYLEGTDFGYRLSTAPITIGQSAGVEDEYLYYSTNNLFYGKARFLETKNRVYFFSIAYPQNKQVAQDVTTFLNSFKLSSTGS